MYHEAYSVFTYMDVSAEKKIIELTKPLLPLATEREFSSQFRIVILSLFTTIKFPKKLLGARVYVSWT